MAISERTRKTLWVKAGGRCSYCHVLLVNDGTGSDPASVFGQEAHIVAQSPGGPRAGQVAEVDSYDNLILLCSIDHKRVDDQPEHFTIERLKSIKLDHEAWVRAQGEVPAEGVLVPEPAAAAPAPAFTLAFAVSIHLSEEVLFYLALAFVVLAFAWLFYQSYRSAHLA
jgi:hypothetical protein